MIRTLAGVMAAAAGALVLGGVVYQRAGEYRDRKRFPAPGTRIRTPEGHLHVKMQGTGEPAVILEAGIAASSLSWSYVQPELSRYTRTVSYDRAGLGWSDLGRKPMTLPGMVEQLSDLLRAAGIGPPYVLVGHSFGGLLVRAFAHVRPNDVAGLVLVDPVSVEAWATCSSVDTHRLRVGASLSRRGAWLARLGVVRFALAIAMRGGHHVTGMIAKASAGRATPLLGRLVNEVRKLPAAVLPLARAEWCRAKSFEAMARHLEALPSCASLTAELTVGRQIPVTVLSAGTAKESELREREEWVNGSNRGRHVMVSEAGHWLHLERPELVVDAAKALLNRLE